MTESQQLLQAYVTNGSEPAFRELVGRYINFVYSTARRLVDGDTQLAQDVTQTVFINLAKTAYTLAGAVSLGSWLHQHTFHVATKAARTERRRQARERKAVELTMLHDESKEHWEAVSPLLDEAICQLSRDDRAAILLRFFEERDFRSVGQALGSSEDAARMRVQRALEKLHRLLQQRGIQFSSAALGSALASHAVSAAPAGLAATTATLALTSAAATTGITLTLIHLMATLPVKLSLATLVLAGSVTTLVVQHQRQVSQRVEAQALREQIVLLTENNETLSNGLTRVSQVRTPRLPAPPLKNTVPAPGIAGETFSATNLYLLITNKTTKLSPDQLGHYLEANKRNAASLLAAFRTTGEPELLTEAMQKYPDQAQVSFEAAVRKDAPPEERRHWLEAFKGSAPENALANYLSAADYFKSGQIDAGVQELVAATGKKDFKDYTLERVQDDEEAYRAAGYTVSESKLMANHNMLLPQLVQMKDLNAQILDLANSYQQSGDQASRQTALEMGLNMGRRYSEPAPGETLLSELVGVAVEHKTLASMDPRSAYDSSGQTVQERMDELAQRRTAIRELNEKADPIWKALTEQDWISYNSRSLAFGEHAALQWLVGKNGQP